MQEIVGIFHDFHFVATDFEKILDEGQEVDFIVGEENNLFFSTILSFMKVHRVLDSEDLVQLIKELSGVIQIGKE